MRLAGVTVPLFSVRSTRDWGIGEIADIPAFGRLAKDAGFGLIQILPPHELAAGESSPYGARTGFGIDPSFLSIDVVAKAEAIDPAELVDEARLGELIRLRALPHVDYVAVRALKMPVLERLFARFLARDWEKKTPRARALSGFLEREAGWEDDLALYVAIREEQKEHGWETWPMPLRLRDPASLAETRARLLQRVLFHGWLQWHAFTQWDEARTALAADKVLLMGDLPFVVCRESADVWAHGRLFRKDRTLGAPPDGFTPEGQDWGLPPYAWDDLARQDYAWLRARARHAAKLYDAFRVDHVVGFFRQYVREPKMLGVFDPKEESAQAKNGNATLSAMKEAARGAQIVAEDLGVIPDFVRKSLDALGLPGYRVLPWEKEKNGALRDPKDFPELSVATWSTHDTAPLRAWWPELPPADRKAFLALAKTDDSASADDREAALFRLLFGARSDLALVLAPELFGETTRINEPGQIGPQNWSYRIPCAVDDLDAATKTRIAKFAAWTKAGER
ncbi:4-alpha-glucanotransferase [soil metagenome]